MWRVAPGLVCREGLRRAVARLLIAALVLPAPIAAAEPPPTAPPRAGALADVAPPEASCPDSLRSGAFPMASVAQGELWPANHGLVDVGLRVNAGPFCAGVALRRVAIYSNEPDDAIGDGATINDAQLDTPDLYLRAERQGVSDGRVYLIEATVSDSGVTGRACTAVVVPKSQSKKNRDALRAQATAAVLTCEASGPPDSFVPLAEGLLDAANKA